MFTGRGYTAEEIVLMCIGGAVLVMLGCFLIYLAYHFARAFVYNVSYHRWHLKVMRINGRKPKWKRFGHSFAKNWLEFLGWQPEKGTIRVGSSYWHGIGNFRVVKDAKFVEPIEPSDLPDDDDEPDDHINLESEIDIDRRQQERNPRNAE